MSESRALWLVAEHPHPAALARHARDGRVFAVLRRLEACGLLTRRRGVYRLTERGRNELDVTRALMRLVARTQTAAL